MQTEIITLLKKANGYLSGEEISRQFQLSRAAIWKNIQELRRQGYDIVAVPHRGYELVSCPDRLFPHEIQFGLKTKIFGKEIVAYESIGSTMDEAFRLGFEGAAEGTVVCAETQTKGRGRLGRNWTSPKGKGLYFSLILRPSLPPTDVARVTLLAAVAVSEAIQRIGGANPQIKWPNDLLIDGKKVAGILTEMSAEMDRVRFVVLGVGINVNTPLSLLPGHSTSLRAEMKKTISRIQLFQEVLGAMERWYTQLQKEGFDPVIKKWKKLSATLGRRVQIKDPNGTVEGEAIDLDEHGGLIIRNDLGMRVQRMTGDVYQLQ
jgi:BirA family biotin operon repressor/biotin-[acetyl-CoA-carboxylase] ligase